jgi:hypothetical protein
VKKLCVQITLIIVLLAPVLVTYSVLQYHKHQVKRSVKRQIIQGIDRVQLVALKFHKDEITTQLSWKHSKEFEFRGEMYDIVDTEFRGDSIVYYCWWDHEETQLNKKLDKLAAQVWNSEPLQQKHNHHLSNFLKSLYFDHSVSSECVCGVEQKGEIGFESHFFFHLAFAPPSPPPQKI